MPEMLHHVYNIQCNCIIKKRCVNVKQHMLKVFSPVQINTTMNMDLNLIKYKESIIIFNETVEQINNFFGYQILILFMGVFVEILRLFHNIWLILERLPYNLTEIILTICYVLECLIVPVSILI